MRKYLFLITLFIIYLIVISINDSRQVLSYNDKYKESVFDVTLKIDDGINSNDLKEMFIEYNGEYFISNINDLRVSCDNINICINDIYQQNDEMFNILYKTTGFKVQKIKFLSYKDEVTEFLDKYNFVYVIN